MLLLNYINQLDSRNIAKNLYKPLYKPWMLDKQKAYSR